jgi:hypothetical protein
MTEADPTLAMIAATFHDFDVAKSRGGYRVLDVAAVLRSPG